MLSFMPLGHVMMIAALLGDYLLFPPLQNAGSLNLRTSASLRFGTINTASLKTSETAGDFLDTVNSNGVLCVKARALVPHKDRHQ